MIKSGKKLCQQVLPLKEVKSKRYVPGLGGLVNMISYGRLQRTRTRTRRPERMV